MYSNRNAECKTWQYIFLFGIGGRG